MESEKRVPGEDPQTSSTEDSSPGRSLGLSCSFMACSASCQWLQDPHGRPSPIRRIPAFRSRLSDARRQKSGGFLPLGGCAPDPGVAAEFLLTLYSQLHSCSSLPGSHLFPSLGFWASYHFFELAFCSIHYLPFLLKLS